MVDGCLMHSSNLRSVALSPPPHHPSFYGPVATPAGRRAALPGEPRPAWGTPHLLAPRPIWSPIRNGPLLPLQYPMPPSRPLPHFRLGGNFAPKVEQGLQAFLAMPQIGRDGGRPVAALDFDQTMHRGDCAWNCFIALMTTGDLRLTDEQLEQVLVLPDPAVTQVTVPRPELGPEVTQDLPMSALRADILSAFGRHQAARSRRATTDLASTVERNNLADLRVKSALFCLGHEQERQRHAAQALQPTHTVAPLWLSWFAGYSPTELQQLARMTHTALTKTPIRAGCGGRWTTASPGHAGHQTYAFRYGSTSSPAMRRLVQDLDAANFDVYVVSGGVHAIVHATLQAQGFAIDAAHVLANHYHLNEVGRATLHQIHSSEAPRTYGPGKADLLRLRQLAPAFVAADRDDAALFGSCEDHPQPARLFVHDGQPSPLAAQARDRARQAPAGDWSWLFQP